MKGKHILLIVLGLVVLYIVLYKLKVLPGLNLKCRLDPNCSVGGKEGAGAEEKAGAFGRTAIRSRLLSKEDEPCVCQGHFIGNMSPGKCKRQCKKANNFNF